MTDQMPRSERAAREVLASNGESNPHPALLADTIREVEYHEGTHAQQNHPPTPTPTPTPTHTVAKNEYEVPCTHPMCDVFHKNLDDEHLVHRTEWVILEDGDRHGWAGTVDAFERKRDAVAYVAAHAPVSHD